MYKIKATVENLSFALDGQQLLSIKTKQDCMPLFDELKDKELSVEIKTYRKGRSLNANGYMWSLLKQLSDKLGNMTKEDLYRHYVKQGNVFKDATVSENAADTLCHAWAEYGTGWITEKVDFAMPGFVIIRLYYGSSVYNTKQMSKLIDLVVQDCKALGIETMTPEQLAVLKNDWRADEKHIAG